MSKKQNAAGTMCIHLDARNKMEVALEKHYAESLRLAAHAECLPRAAHAECLARAAHAECQPRAAHAE